jgi:hypothetical protein
VGRWRWWLTAVGVAACPVLVLASDFGALRDFLVLWVGLAAMALAALCCALFDLSYRDRRIWHLGFPAATVLFFVALAALVWLAGR